MIDPQPSDEIRALTGRGVRINASAADVGAVSTMVVAVKPQTFARRRCRRCATTPRPSTLVVSIMAGIPIAALARRSAAMSSARCRTRRRRSAAASPWRSPRADVTAAQRATADALLRATGAVEWVEDESLIDAVTAVSGSGPAYVFLLAEELARAGVAAGLPEAARR